MTKKTVKKTPLKIPTRRVTSIEYAIVGRRRGRLVWFCSVHRRNNWCVDGDRAVIYYTEEEARRALPYVTLQASRAIEDISLAKLTYNEVDTGCIIR